MLPTCAGIFFHGRDGCWKTGRDGASRDNSNNTSSQVVIHHHHPLLDHHPFSQSASHRHRPHRPPPGHPNIAHTLSITLLLPFICDAGVGSRSNGHLDPPGVYPREKKKQKQRCTTSSRKITFLLHPPPFIWEHLQCVTVTERRLKRMPPSSPPDHEFLSFPRIFLRHFDLSTLPIRRKLRQRRRINLTSTDPQFSREGVKKILSFSHQRGDLSTLNVRRRLSEQEEEVDSVEGGGRDWGGRRLKSDKKKLRMSRFNRCWKFIKWILTKCHESISVYGSEAILVEPPARACHSIFSSFSFGSSGRKERVVVSFSSRPIPLACLT